MNWEFTQAHANRNQRYLTTRGKNYSNIIPAGSTCTGHRSGPILWCIQEDQSLFFLDPGFFQPSFVIPLYHFLDYAWVQTLLFDRPCFLPEQARHTLKQSIWLISLHNL